MRLLIILSLFTGILLAQVPQLVNYQGKLMTTEGLPVADGAYKITFTIYDENDSNLWQEIHATVPVKDGIFNVLLGSVETMPLTLFNSENRFLGIKVNEDQEMIPKFKLTSVAYAFKAAMADAVPPNSIIAASLSDNAVSTSKIENDAVTGPKIADGQVVKEINGLKDNVILSAGENIQLDPQGNRIIINATAGGAAGVQSLNALQGKVKIVGSSNVSVDTPTDSTVRIMVVDTSGGGTGDITAVIAGTGLTGGAFLGDAELHVGQETGILVTDAGVGLDTVYTDERYVSSGEINSVTGDMIVDGEIIAGDLATGSVTTDKIRSTGASTNDVITYNGSTVVWAAPSAATDSDWEINGSNVYKTSGYVGLGIDAPVYPIHLIPPSTQSTGFYLDMDRTVTGRTWGMNLNVANTIDNQSQTYGIYSTASKPAGTSETYGLYGWATGLSTGPKYGVYGQASGSGTELWGGAFDPSVLINSPRAGGDGLTINNTATDGDPVVTFQLSGTNYLTMGVDDSDGNKFKIGTTDITTNNHLTIDQSGHVGLGTETPSAHLEVTGNDGVLFGGTYLNGNIPAEGTGVRMMWYPYRAAIRAGSIDSSFPTYWDSDSIGSYSTAFGLNVKARGYHSLAIGRNLDVRSTGGIALGYQLDVFGDYATAIGRGCTAENWYSISIGRFLTNTHQGAVLIGDGSGTYMSSAADNRFHARFDGGYYLYSNAAQTAGVYIGAGGNSWSSVSDSTRKENFKAVNGEDVLSKISTFNLRSWNYIGQDPSQYRHYGPMAQEFYEAFGHDGIGTIGNDTTIASADFDGINLIAIHALEKRTQDLQDQIDKLKNENRQLQAVVAELNQVVAQTGQLRSELIRLKKMVSKILDQPAEKEKISLTTGTINGDL